MVSTAKQERNVERQQRRCSPGCHRTTHLKTLRCHVTSIKIKHIKQRGDELKMTVCTKCEDQFCDGHIAEPNKQAIKLIMQILRSSANPNNRFFIAIDDGRLMSSAYLSLNDNCYFDRIPKGSYEMGAGKKQSKSYAILKTHLHEMYVEAAKQEQ